LELLRRSVHFGRAIATCQRRAHLLQVPEPRLDMTSGRRTALLGGTPVRWLSTLNSAKRRCKWFRAGRWPRFVTSCAVGSASGPRDSLLAALKAIADDCQNLLSQVRKSTVIGNNLSRCRNARSYYPSKACPVRRGRGNAKRDSIKARPDAVHGRWFLPCRPAATVCQMLNPLCEWPDRASMWTPETSPGTFFPQGS
jgi:hypothetical protein